LEILWQLRNSVEAASHDPGIAGFDRALRRARIRSLLPRALRRLRTDERASGTRSATAVALDAAPAAPDSDVDVAAHEAMAAELQSLKNVVNGLGHALRGVANAQVRYEQQIAALLATIATARDADAVDVKRETVQ
jgi:hypothetical protein